MGYSWDTQKTKIQDNECNTFAHYPQSSYVLENKRLDFSFLCAYIVILNHVSIHAHVLIWPSWTIVSFHVHDHLRPKDVPSVDIYIYMYVTLTVLFTKKKNDISCILSVIWSIITRNHFVFHLVLTNCKQGQHMVNEQIQQRTGQPISALINLHLQVPRQVCPQMNLQLKCSH